jgi:hypothetical protein
VLLFYDSAALKEKHDGSQFFDVPLLDLALKNGGDKIMVNTVATGTVLGMLGLGTDIFLDILGKFSAKKGKLCFLQMQMLPGQDMNLQGVNVCGVSFLRLQLAQKKCLLALMKQWDLELLHLVASFILHIP